jgi:hypothetical protein
MMPMISPYLSIRAEKDGAMKKQLILNIFPPDEQKENEGHHAEVLRRLDDPTVRKVIELMAKAMDAVHRGGEEGNDER